LGRALPLWRACRGTKRANRRHYAPMLPRTLKGSIGLIQLRTYTGGIGGAGKSCLESLNSGKYSRPSTVPSLCPRCSFAGDFFLTSSDFSGYTTEHGFFGSGASAGPAGPARTRSSVRLCSATGSWLPVLALSSCLWPLRWRGDVRATDRR
jgi:hypothetical protein